MKILLLAKVRTLQKNSHFNYKKFKDFENIYAINYEKFKDFENIPYIYVYHFQLNNLFPIYINSSLKFDIP